MKNNQQIMKKVLHHIGKYKFFLLLSIIMAAASVALTLYIPILTGDAIDCIIGPQKVNFKGIFVILQKMCKLSSYYRFLPLLKWEKGSGSS